MEAAIGGPTAWMKRLPVLMVAAWSIAFLAEVLLSIRSCDGQLIYSLDDPYIHLAVAENILRGGYGINASEYSSPSSSIAFPFLLAGTEALGLGAWGPLVLNAAAAAGAVYGAGRILTLAFPTDRLTSGLVTFVYAAAATIILAMNAIALPMTGLEHMGHVLLVVLTLLGLLRLATEGRAPWLIAPVVALTLFRFEGAAMAAAAMAAMWGLGDRRGAVVALGLTAALLGAYFAFMHSLGLPLLPSSVLLKSDLASATTGDGPMAGALAAIWDNLGQAVNQVEGRGLLLLALAILARCIVELRAQRRPQHLAIGFVALATIGAHLVAGHYGWFGRYEVYAATAGVLATIVLYGEVLAAHQFAVGARAVVLGLLFVVARNYLEPTLSTPAAARGIYEQQYQMHRFVTEFWPGPVAVNDLGWVSYRNDEVVLDLFGLGSEKVRRLRSAGHLGAAEIDQLARRDHVGLSMIYDRWFCGSLPGTWRRVAVLHTTQVVSASTDVSFYATDPADTAGLTRALKRFSPTLPRGSSLTILPLARKQDPAAQCGPRRL